ncbi:MAG: HD-GYP domain-containing protein [Lachnospiraceae bacterium]|nr:HD-GYP domain-containing protein [Lachnospiraceae bacterium]
MKNRKGRPSFVVIVFIVIAILLGGAFTGISIYCQRESNTLREYRFSGVDLSEPIDGISLSMEISKNWNSPEMYPGNPVGAEYDFALTNNSEWEFENWSAEIYFTNNLIIDSSWNGKFEVDQNKINFKADGDAYSLEPNMTRKMGAVIYSRELLGLESCTVYGYSKVRPDKMPVFWMLVGAAIIYASTLIGYLVFSMRVAYFHRQHEKDMEIIRQSMNTLTDFIDAKDSYTKGHSSRVATYSKEIAKRMGLSDNYVTDIYYIALMHDCGKIGIPDAVLKKPDKLTKAEYELIQSHTVLGDSVLGNFTAIKGISDGAHYHHERYDGKGYPEGIKGESIPLCARIIGVADATDAMSSNRCYREKLGHEQIINELNSNSGKQFDPAIVPIMVDMINQGFLEKTQDKIPNNL